jgi:uncharacterized protein YdcH (DUF465 family)
MHPPLLSHDLSQEFPDLAGKIDLLKMSNPRFARLLGDHEVVDKQIYQSEKGSSPLDGLALEELKRQRLRLKDELCQLLKDG